MLEEEIFSNINLSWYKRLNLTEIRHNQDRNIIPLTTNKINLKDHLELGSISCSVKEAVIMECKQETSFKLKIVQHW